jgi:hypothetical protein
MNLWKPIALCAIAACVVSVGVQARASSGAADKSDGIAAGPCHDQPNMANAVRDLKAARGWLEKAEHNKGGWRVAAIEATDKAIHEADRGCAFADAH